MKNQYFGDVNDYRKYGLLRILTGFGSMTSSICWMLTADDGRTDGGKIDYLLKPAIWNKYDEELFFSLRDAVVYQNDRRVGHCSERNLIPSANYFNLLLKDDLQERAAYFYRFISESRGKDLVFFDPDNGMEIKSVPKGRKNSSRYLYWDELQECANDNTSILIYQHFPRQKRETFISKQVSDFRKTTLYRLIYSFKTSHVVFFLLISGLQEKVFESAVQMLKKIWGDQFQVIRHFNA